MKISSLCVVVLWFMSIIVITDESKLPTTIGIDIGTTNTFVAEFRNGRAEILAALPSFVAFTSIEHSRNSESQFQEGNPRHNITVFSIKRIMEQNIQKKVTQFPFACLQKEDSPHVEINVQEADRENTIEDFVIFLRNMKELAERSLGCPVTNAVVSIPLYFNEMQREMIIEAGKIAELQISRVLSQPFAAAIAHGMEQKHERNILVYHLGGRTFELSVLTVDEGIFEILATFRDNHLGGSDFDEQVLEYLLNQLKAHTKIYERVSNESVQKLRSEVEMAKRTLSTQHQTNIEIKCFIDRIDFSETLTREIFESVNAGLFTKTFQYIDAVLSNSGLSKQDIDDIILVGGSAHIPKIQQLLQDYFHGNKAKLNIGIHPDFVAAYGAAAQADFISGDKIKLPLLLMSMVPLSLGIETVGGEMKKIVPRNSYIPTEKSHMFSTNENYQETMLIQVYEGERIMTKDNNLLGEFELIGIPLAMRGEPQIKVSFNIDTYGILIVEAELLETGIRNQTTIFLSEQNRLSNHQITQILQAAEYAAESETLLEQNLEGKNLISNKVKI